MPKVVLSEARIKKLKPQKSSYDLRDAKLKGFGVRVLPSGAKRFFIHTQYCGERIWKIVGNANSMTVAEARTRAASMVAAIKQGADTPAPHVATLFEAVAEATFQRHTRVWKTRTLYVNRSYLRRQILPWFAGRQIADITHHDVRRWFASLRATPVAADRSMPVLSVIMNEAETLSYRPEGSNPCRGVKRYRRKGRERFLTDDEIGRLARRLSTYENEWPSHVAAVRLLLLTGCRRNEILTLRWSDYRDGHLFLRDSKTGPRTVWLSCAARDVFDHIDRRGIWVFPAPESNELRGPYWLNGFWQRLCSEANLTNMRLHDIRHSYASFALRQGESVLAIGRLLGHASAKTTLKYTHLADSMVREAVQTVGTALEGAER